LPVVCSDIPTLRELSGDGRRLMLVSQGDADSFMAAIHLLRDHPQRRREQSERARLWAAANLDPQRTIAETIRAYETVLAGRRRSPVAGG